jgi:hypothetical protein
MFISKIGSRPKGALDDSSLTGIDTETARADAPAVK